MTEPYVVARNLSKAFDKSPILENLSFEIEPGEVIGILGKNGAGKTTLLELMLGFTPPSMGSVQVFGHDSFRMPNSAKERIGFVPQQDELVNQLTAKQQIAVIASFYRHWDGAMIERLCEAWEVDPHKQIKTMSIGQRQKLSILLSLGHRPDLVILDEPVASLDPLARRQFLEQIVDLAADGNRSVVLSSHIVSDIERLANKIWILKDRRLYWRGDFDALKESIVRIHVRSSSALSEPLSIPNAFSVRCEGAYASAIVRDWSVDLHSETENRIGAQLEVETLALEDIFLELHR